MLFIPGFMQRGDAWRPVAELLPERYPSRMLDHAEHSFEGRLTEIRSPGRASWWATRWAAGWRCGPLCALPSRFGGVVLVGSTAGIEEAPLRAARAEADERLASWIEAASMEDVVSVWERQPLFADQSDALVEGQRPGRLSQDQRSLALLLRTAGQGVLEPVWHQLSQLELPVLAIAGARDDGYSRAAKRIASTAPKGRAAIVEEAGHAAHLQQPEEVARRLVEFLDDLR